MESEIWSQTSAGGSQDSEASARVRWRTVHHWLRGSRGRQLGISLGMTLLVGWMLWSERRGAQMQPISAPRFLVAKRTLDAGEFVDWADFGITPDAPSNAENAVTDQDLEKIAGGRMVKTLEKSEVLTFDAIRLPHAKSIPIPAGQFAYAVKVRRGASVRLGDHVDLLWNGGDGNGMQTVLRDVPVVEIPRRSENDPEILVVSLALKAAQIQTAEKAAQSGTLSLAVRPTTEGVPEKSEPFRPRVKGRRPVELWSE